MEKKETKALLKKMILKKAIKGNKTMPLSLPKGNQMLKRKLKPKPGAPFTPEYTPGSYKRGYSKYA